jgi:hypothetical protein
VEFRRCQVSKPAGFQRKEDANVYCGLFKNFKGSLKSRRIKKIKY